MHSHYPLYSSLLEYSVGYAISREITRLAYLLIYGNNQEFNHIIRNLAIPVKYAISKGIGHIPELSQFTRLVPSNGKILANPHLAVIWPFQEGTPIKSMFLKIRGFKGKLPHLRKYHIFRVF